MTPKYFTLFANLQIVLQMKASGKPHCLLTEDLKKHANRFLALNVSSCSSFFMQHLLSALFTIKRALMRYVKVLQILNVIQLYGCAPDKNIVRAGRCISAFTILYSVML